MAQIKLNREAIGQILTSPATVAAVDAEVQRVRATAAGMYDAKDANGRDYAGDTIIGGGKYPRAHGMVRTDSRHAKRSNAKYNTLVKAAQQ